MPIVKSPSSLSAALAADAAIAAYLRALADRRAAELSAVVERWSTAPLTRGRYQRVVPLREPRLGRVVNSRGEPRAAQTREVR